MEAHQWECKTSKHRHIAFGVYLLSNQFGIPSAIAISILVILEQQAQQLPPKDAIDVLQVH